MTRTEMEEAIPNYVEWLRQREIRERSIDKYLRDIQRFLDFSGDRDEIDKEGVISYKKHLLKTYKPSSVNSYLTSLNRYLEWLDKPQLKVKLERIQRRCSLSNVLEQEDYVRLLDYTRKKGNWKYYCMMRLLAGTGIRIGELRYITCEAAKTGMTTIRHKGKVREICIPEQLGQLLLWYCDEAGIRKGIIFVGRDGVSPVDVSGVWKGFKRLAEMAGVSAERVYPHSFRHFFAKTYMRVIGNLTELCDILGHSSIETTRIYTKETAREKRESLAKLGM